MAKEYEKFATENKGVFRIGSMDCDEYKALCDKEKVNTFPTMRLYPTFPIPESDVNIEKFDKIEIRGYFSRLIFARTL